MSDELPKTVTVSGAEIAVSGWDEEQIRQEALFKVVRKLVPHITVTPMPNEGDARVFSVQYPPWMF